MNLPSSHASRPIVLVTGSSGLIGSRLLEELADDYYLIGLDRDENPQHLAHIHWIHCDLTDEENVKQAFRSIADQVGRSIASVVHLAAYYDFSGEPSPLYQELTVKGTRRVLRELSNFKLEQFVFSSSLLVMQSSDDDRPLTADSPVEAEWDYPQSKLEAEKVIAAEQGDFSAVILRLAGVYDEDCHSLPLAQQISRIYEKQLQSYVFPGDKTHGQSFIHLDDVLACVHAAIDHRNELPRSETFLIGEEQVMSYEELQNVFGQLLHGEKWPAIRIPKLVAKAGAWLQGQLPHDEEHDPFIKPWMIDLADQNYPVNLRRARKELKWEPQHSLAETLPEMIGRLKDDPRRWYEVNNLPLPQEYLI